MTNQGILLTLIGKTVVGKTRSKNEDSFVISDLTDPSLLHATTSPVCLPVTDRGVLVAVSDGMGGANAGEVASSLVVDSLQHGMSTVQANSAGVALRVSVEASNQEVVDAAQAPGRAGMGATLTALLFHDVYAYIAEIGDSRAYLLRAGRIVQLTRDQSFVQELIDSGALTLQQAETSPFKNAVLQAMGLSPKIVVAMNRISIRRHDRFLLCSDGLSGKLGDEEMLSIILRSASPKSACAELIETAVEHGSADDITVVLVDVNGEGAPALTDTERLSLESPTLLDPTQQADVAHSAESPLSSGS